MTDTRIPLLTALCGAGADRAAQVTVGDRCLSRAELSDAARAVAGAVAGAERAAFTATADLDTVITVVGCLLAGVTAVPVPADAGPRERRHILDDAAPDL